MNTEALKFNVLPEAELTYIKQKLETIEQVLSIKSEEEISSTYIESKKIPKLLGISLKTWQTYRDKGIIPFIQLGSKIWVKRADLEAFMNKHYIKKVG